MLDNEAKSDGAEKSFDLYEAADEIISNDSQEAAPSNEVSNEGDKQIASPINSEETKDVNVDEILGKLNDSKDTKGTNETNKNYHLEFFTILGKLAENTNICIIDHSLPIEWFQTVLDIVKYDNGISELIKK